MEQYVATGRLRPSVHRRSRRMAARSEGDRLIQRAPCPLDQLDQRPVQEGQLPGILGPPVGQRPAPSGRRASRVCNCPAMSSFSTPCARVPPWPR